MVGLSDNSTAAGVWNLSNIDPIAQTASYISTTLLNLTAMKELRIDTDRLLFTYGSGTTSLYAQIYNETTQTWGTPTLVRATAGNHIAAITGANQALVCSNNSTAFQAVVLTFSGTSITVGTATSATSSGGITQYYSLFSVGSSWVVTYYPTLACVAMTISGTTVTIGSEIFPTGTSATYVQPVAVSSTVFFVVSLINVTTIYVEGYSVSGTTITVGTSIGVTLGPSESAFRFTPISSGTRWAIAYCGGSTDVYVGIISMSGSTPSVSNVVTGVTLSGGSVNIAAFDMIASGSKLILVSAISKLANIVTDTSGTASAGTAVAVPTSTTSVSAVTTNSNIAVFVTTNSTTAPSLANRLGINFSGSSPTLDTNADLVASTVTFSYGGFPINSFNGNFTNAKRGAWFYGTVNYNFYTFSTGVIVEVMAIQNQHMYKAITRARPPISAPATTLVVGVSGNELVYYSNNFAAASTHGAVNRFESIT
jgi:hypothetical protein